MAEFWTIVAGDRVQITKEEAQGVILVAPVFPNELMCMMFMEHAMDKYIQMELDERAEMNIDLSYEG